MLDYRETDIEVEETRISCVGEDEVVESSDFQSEQ